MLSHGVWAMLSGGQPAAMAQQLIDAPQAVPFEQRIEVLRALIAADRDRYPALVTVTISSAKFCQAIWVEN